MKSISKAAGSRQQAVKSDIPRYSVKGKGAKTVIYDSVRGTSAPVEPDMAQSVMKVMESLNAAPATASAKPSSKASAAKNAPAAAKTSVAKTAVAKKAAGVAPAKKAQAKKSQVKKPAPKAASAAAAEGASEPSTASPKPVKKTAAKKSVKKAVAKKQPVKKAAKAAKAAKPGPKAKPKMSPTLPEQADRRRRHPAPPALVQNKGEMPAMVADFLPRYQKGKALLTRRFFEKEAKWGYRVQIDGKDVGSLLFERESAWLLTPSREKNVSRRFARKNIETSFHKTPVSAAIRVLNIWVPIFAEKAAPKPAPVQAPAPAAEAEPVRQEASTG